MFKHFKNLASPSETAVKKHIGILTIQAGFLLALASFFTAMQLYAEIQEASLPQLPNSIASPLAYGPSGEIIDGINSRVEEKHPTDEEENANAVLGAESEEFEELDNLPNTTPTPTAPTQPKKDSYSIAIYGDSMVDTMGERLEYLEKELQERYPNTTFHLYNYGVGSQNIHDGLARWNKPLLYVDREYPAVTEVKPDIFIAGSFGYNVLVPHNRDAHWLGYTELVQRAQKISPNVYMLAEIIPCRRGFGFGPNGVNWEPATAWSHTEKIVEQLENVLGLSPTLRIPLINAYTPSMEEGKKDCRKELVNPSDNIHPSVEGHQFIAKIIADTIELR